MLKIFIALSLSLVMLACAQAAELPADFAAGEKRGWFSVKASPAEIIGAEAAANFVKGMDADQDLEFLIYVPESWEPGTPIGLLSYITPRRQAILPAGWGPALDETNMIFVELNRSGNSRRAQYRAYETILATYLIANHYPVDASRVYVAGFSGGGRMASMLAPTYAATFRGAIFICGVNRLDATEEQKALMRQNRYVFYTGARDQNRRETRSIFSQYKNEGIENVLLIDDRNATHQTPRGPELIEAIRFLDGEAEAE
ncbi:prolyl oligopeptidase family serine peptidase [Parvularcula marina]|uniref:Peptidase S9 prolyl oligopeptidase catalytic domain-containing protein n=1 Tax=Parvularcula marina TaxID=2292771 RepID=A0A371RIB7_9PROT|nr:prolyl oligopeptidase family serine peptidase [Parvularcula marina]RFB05178.1 hypothetical protein DX908_07875 [Parvularcula marina]